MSEASIANHALIREAVAALSAIDPALRSEVVIAALAFQPTTPDTELQIAGPIRAAFAAFWEELSDEAVPLNLLRSILTQPEHCRGLMNLSATNDADMALRTAFDYLAALIEQQRQLWKAHAEQLQRTNCPSCGEGDCTF